jgi:CO/xanthine dehydrogenase Mo-binding subunit
MAKRTNPNVIPPYVIGDTPVPETPKPTEELMPWKETSTVGQAIPRVDAYNRVSGSATYTYDVYLPDMLYARILRCPHAHAKVISIDISEAEKMEGVYAVITKDSSEAKIKWNYGRGQRIQHSFIFDPVCRFAGEEVAAVAARNPYIAADALSKIKVEYEILDHVVDPEEALEEGATKIWENGNVAGASNYVRGDVEAGFAAADQIVDIKASTSTAIHTPLEVHGSVAKWDGDKLTLWDSTQGVYSVMFQIAEAFGLPFNKVRVKCPYVGGGFGGKLRLYKQGVIAGILARKTAKPVKVMLTREDSLLCVGNRPAARMGVKAGVKKDGTIAAIDYSNIASPGAYAEGAGTFFQVAELYSCKNIRSQEKFSFTNAGRAAAMRAPGFPQCSFSLEQAMDAMAEKIGMDPVEFRIKNVPAFSQIDREQRPYTVNELAQCLSKGAEAFNWQKARSRGNDDGSHIKRGVGCAAAVWVVGGGGPPSTVICKMFVDGSVTIRTGAMDIGTGTKTVLCMIVAEELGMPIERVSIENADTANTPYATPSGGSKTLPTEGPTARNAAHELKKNLHALAAKHMQVDEADVEFQGYNIISKSDSTKKTTVTEVFRRNNVYDLVGVGYRGDNTADKVIRTWAAQFAEVEVNTLTGKVTVSRLLSASESGRVINKLTYNNQVFGGMAMGLGLGMTEGRVMDKGQTGKMTNVSWLDYKIPTAKDVPFEQDSLAIDPPDTECNNLGAKGLGEPITIPTAAAIANAIYHATGVQIEKAPMTPVELVKALQQKRRS